jgi:hypothetical protein
MSTAHWQARRLPIPAAWPARSSPAARQWAIVPAGLAPILLTGAYLIAGILQPASYSPMRTTISVMAGQAGTDRWVMTGGLFLAGGCYLVTAAGLTGVRAPARALLIVAGLAGIGIAASPEPASGATPRHLAWTVLGAVTIAVWPAFAARRTSPRPLILSVYGSAAVTAVFVALLGWLFIETRDGSVLGLAERLTSSIQTCWPFIIALTLRRARPRPAAHAQPERPAPGARSSPGYPADRPSAQSVPAIPGRVRTPPGISRSAELPLDRRTQHGAAETAASAEAGRAQQNPAAQYVCATLGPWRCPGVTGALRRSRTPAPPAPRSRGTPGSIAVTGE